MEKIKVSDLLARSAPTLLAYTVFSSMVAASQREDLAEKFHLPDNPEGNVDLNHEVAVEMTVNGVPVSIMPLFRAWEEQHDRMVKDEAKKLLREKLSGFNGAEDLLYDIHKYIEHRAGEVLGEGWQDR